MKHSIYIMLAAAFLLPAAVCPGEEQSLGLKTVVIDAGHGGKDPGAVSKSGKTLEKDIVLDVALKLADKIRAGYPDVKVVLTRSTDVFISLNERAAKANRANADLFISIHVNANNNPSANGFSLHVMGQSHKKGHDLYAGNMDVCRRENSVILLEDDYSTTYQGFNPNDPESYIFMQLMQNAYLEQSLDFASRASDEFAAHGPVKRKMGIYQDPFYVLWKTAMPAVLVEIGFVSNDSDRAILIKPENRTQIAGCLYDAFSSYKKAYDESLDISEGKTESAAAVEKEPETTPAAVAEPESAQALAVQETKPAQQQTGVQTAQQQAAAQPAVKYAVQAFAGANKLKAGDKAFLGYSHIAIKSGNLYRYYIGVSDSKAQTEKYYQNIKSKYPDSFIVKITGQNVERVK